MALTITNVFKRPQPVGELWFNVVKVDFDNSYPTGGAPLTANDLGFRTASSDDAQFHVQPAQVGGYTIEYDHTNHTLKVYEEDGAAVGKEALPEVPNATDLSGLTGVHVAAYGKYRL